jgi:hypothetical protein
MAHHKRSMTHRKSSRRHSKARRTRARRGGGLERKRWPAPHPPPSPHLPPPSPPPPPPRGGMWDMSGMKQTLPPGELVQVADLQPGKMYLIKSENPEKAHLTCKGMFVSNDEHPNGVITTHFTNVVTANNTPYTNLYLPNTLWNYYDYYDV